MKKVFFLFIAWRLFLFLPLLFGHFFLSYRFDSPYTRIWYFIQPYFPVNSFLLYPWANFDGVHYLSIAGNGYIDDGRFFPLFPLLISFVSHLFGGVQAFGAIQFFVGLILSNLFFFLSLIVLYKLVQMDFSKRVAFWSLLFPLVFPTSFYFASIYSESLFLLLTALSFYFARNRKWLAAGLCGALLSATRIVGISILPALLYEFLQSRKKVKESWAKILPLFLIPLGLISYMFFNLQKWKDPLYFLHAQGFLANGREVDTLISPFQTVFRYIKILTTVSLVQYEWWIALLELLAAFLGVIFLYLSFKKKIRFSYIIFALLCFSIPVLSGTFSALPRYVLVLFPFYITYALIENKIIWTLLLTIFLVLLFLLCMVFSRGYFVA